MHICMFSEVERHKKVGRIPHLHIYNIYIHIQHYISHILPVYIYVQQCMCIQMPSASAFLFQLL
jgi:hypothetical protein